MKKYLFIILFSLNFTAFAGVNPESRTQFQNVEQYQIEDAYLNIKLPTEYAKPFIIDKSQIDWLAKHEIYQIDLVYTEFKRDPTFNQNKLNGNRIEKLKNLLPQVNKDNPNWNHVAQTKAKDYETANTYYHGFVIYYKPKAINHHALQKKFSAYQTQSKTYLIDNGEINTLNYPSGSKLIIPKNAVCHTDGSQVIGKYEIKYCEYRNPAEIALSGLPMTIDIKGESQNFSSVGMYEIRGKKDGKQLKLQQPITIDFNCTKTVDDAAFYKMDDGTGEWKTIKPIPQSSFGQGLQKVNSKQKIDEVNKVKPKENNVQFDQIIKQQTKANWKIFSIDKNIKIENTRTVDNVFEIKLNNQALKHFIAIKDLPEISPMIIMFDEDAKTIQALSKDVNSLNNSIINKKYTKEQPVQFSTNATLLAEGINKGHTYPNLVKGLNNSDFGVYNCDQIYRISNAKTIHPIYVDAKTKKTIDKTDVACLMDLNYNGSFSFDPKYITLNPKGKNALLLFSSNNRVYLVLPEDLKTMLSENKQPKILMQDVTSSLKTSDDLKVLLKL